MNWLQGLAEKRRDLRGRAVGYVTSVSCLVALILLAGSMVVGRQLSAHRGYATLINLAGRQRMLSQRLAKTVLNLAFRSKDTPHSKAIGELEETLRAWREADDLLAHGELPHANPARLLLVHPSLERM